jgi:hypothetical protein
VLQKGLRRGSGSALHYAVEADDVVECGPGNDRVYTDETDLIADDWEKIILGPARIPGTSILINRYSSGPSPAGPANRAGPLLRAARLTSALYSPNGVEGEFSDIRPHLPERPYGAIRESLPNLGRGSRSVSSLAATSGAVRRRSVTGSGKPSGGGGSQRPLCGS